MKRRPAVFAAVVLLLALAAAPSGAQTDSALFDDAVLHEVRLHMHPADWQSLRDRYLEDTYYPAEWTWRGQVTRNVAVRSRGFGSRNGVKPGLRVNFARYDAHQNFAGLNSVVLRNNVQDPSTLRERLAMLLFQRMGLPAPREAHARLYINDQFFGLYTIVEFVDEVFVRRVFGESEGYLYEYQWAEPYRFEYRGSNPSRYSPSPFRPETHEYDPDAAPLEAMIRAINQASDAEFARAVGEYLDLRQLLAHLAVENFVNEIDGFVGTWGINNFFLYRSQGQRLSRLIAWDKSETFGSPGHPLFWNTQENVLTRRILAIPEWRRVYLEALVRAAVLAGGAGGWWEQELGRAYNQIRASAREDPNKQCPVTGGFQPCTNEQFEAEVVRMRDFVRQRGEYVLRETAAAGFSPPGFSPPDQGPRVAEQGVVSALTNLAGPIAPGSLLSIYGQNLARTAQAASLPLPTTLGGVSVLINGFAAPLLYVSPAQLNVQAPWELTPGTALVTVMLDGSPGNSVRVEVANGNAPD